MTRERKLIMINLQKNITWMSNNVLVITKRAPLSGVVVVALVAIAALAVCLVAIYKKIRANKVPAPANGIDPQVEIRRQGNFISIVHKGDAVLFACERPLEGQANMDYSNYHGLTDRSKVDSLLQNENYIEVLKHVWTETDIKTRIRWLEDKVKEGHAVLGYELALSLLINEPTMECYFYKAVPVLFGSKCRTIADVLCSSDKSVFAAVELLDFFYCQYLSEIVSKISQKDERMRYIKEHDLELKNAYCEVFEIMISSFLRDPSPALPSPRWVFNHGFNKGLGNTIPESTWNSSRQSYLRENLLNLRPRQ